jgi:hypothetical protein
MPAAHATICSAWAAAARTRTWPKTLSAWPVATAVCDPLCGSTPIITTATGRSPSLLDPVNRPWRAYLISDRLALAPLMSHTTARPGGAGTSFGSQAVTGRQDNLEPAPPGLTTLRPNRNA